MLSFLKNNNNEISLIFLFLRAILTIHGLTYGKISQHASQLVWQKLGVSILGIGEAVAGGEQYDY